MNPKYPIYIVSKSRWESRLTSKTLEKMKVFYYIVVEKSQYNDYASVISKDKILILPEKYLNDYDTCDDLGATRSKGPGAARNFCWDHSISLGSDRHWVMDDNIKDFYRLNRNIKWRVDSGTILRVMEDFVDRYENIAIAGPQYEKFAPRKTVLPPYILNTRIYSCLLIKNDIPYRWRGRYNEDTDLCLRALKDGYCTIEFNAFLQGKMTTQILKGGNTEAFYAKEGTLPKSKMIEDLHPDLARVSYKFHRWHHEVDYSQFKKHYKNRLIKKSGINIPSGVNNYGMILKILNK